MCKYKDSFIKFLHFYFPQSIFQPSELTISLAKECVSHGCGVHLFVLSQQDVGGAWPGHIPYLTGGSLHTYSHLQVSRAPPVVALEMKVNELHKEEKLF